MHKLFFVTIMAALGFGCSNYNFSRAVYEGVQTNNQLKSTPVERATTPQMNYYQYDAERKH